MSETQQGETAHFERYFGDEIEKIADSEAEPLHKKILFLAVLDALSKPVYPRRQNRSRFVETVKVFGQWEDGDRVSLLHLDRLLEVHPDPAFAGLRKFVREEVAKWTPHGDSTLDIKCDPPFGEIQRRWPKGSEHERPVGHIGLEHLTHAHLLYRERNLLVHEYREGGGGWDFDELKNPYYQTITRYEGRDSETKERIKTEQWHLVYPTRFLEHLCRTVLAGVSSYLAENELPPFSHYRFGKYWIEELSE